MTILFELEPERKSPPKCCRECKYLDGETSDWDGQFYWYCERNVWFPYKKRTCKKQVLKKQEPYVPVSSRPPSK